MKKDRRRKGPRESGSGGAPEGAASLSDSELLERIQAEDPEAFDALWDRHSAYVNGVCFHFLRSKEEAEDLLQSIFILIWENRLGYKPERSSLTSWLFFIAKSRSLDRLKASNRKLPHDGVPEDLEAPGSFDPERGASTSQQSKQIQDALEELPPEQREAILTCFFRAQTYQEAAEILGIPLGTFKSRVRLAMKKLAVLLRGQEPDE